MCIFLGAIRMLSHYYFTLFSALNVSQNALKWRQEYTLDSHSVTEHRSFTLNPGSSLHSPINLMCTFVSEKKLSTWKKKKALAVMRRTWTFQNLEPFTFLWQLCSPLHGPLCCLLLLLLFHQMSARWLTNNWNYFLVFLAFNVTRPLEE